MVNDIKQFLENKKKDAYIEDYFDNVFANDGWVIYQKALDDLEDYYIDEKYLQRYILKHRIMVHDIEGDDVIQLNPLYSIEDLIEMVSLTESKEDAKRIDEDVDADTNSKLLDLLKTASKLEPESTDKSIIESKRKEFKKIMEESLKVNENIYNHASKYFKEYKIKDDMDIYESSAFFAGVKDELNEINDNYQYLSIILEREGDYVYMYPQFVDTDNVKVGYELFCPESILDSSFISDYNDGTQTFQDDYKYNLNIIKDEINNANKEIAKIARRWGFKNSKPLKENKQETYTLYYDDLTATVTVPTYSATYDEPAGYEEIEVSDSWEYEIDESELEEALEDILFDKNNSPEPEALNMNDEEWEEYFQENKKDLFDRYYDEIADYWKDSASDNFKNNYDYEEYEPDYDDYED